MAQPLLATARIRMPVTVDSIEHVTIAYVRNLQAAGASWLVNSRTTDSNDTDWKDAAGGLWDAMSYLWPTGTPPPTLILEELTGSTWNILDTATGGTGFLSGSVKHCVQVTMTLRDAAFKKVRVISLEGNTPAPGVWETDSPGSSAVQSWMQQWTPNNSVDFPPYLWQASRGDRFLAENPFVHATASLNRIVRKARGFL